MAAVEARVAHRALDGRQFQLSGQLDLRAPSTSVVDVAIGGNLHELTAGTVAFGREVAASLGVRHFDEELSFQGGTLQIARQAPVDAQTSLREERVLAVWRGRAYCFVMQAYGVTTADLLGKLRTLRIEEHADGITVTPDQNAGTYFTAPATVVKRVPGVGLLEMSPLTAQHAKTLPAWRGASTQAGELFQDTMSDGNPYFVLAGQDTYVTVVPLGDTDLGRLPDLVGRLRLQTTG